RAVEAAQKAIASPLLDNTSIEGAKGVLINFTGGMDLALHEVEEAARIVQQAAHDDANIIFGAVIDPALQDELRVTVIATGFTEKKEAVPVPTPLAGRLLEISRAVPRPVTAATAGNGAGAWRRRATEARIEGFE